MARKEEPKIQPNNDLEKRIIEAFEVFDHSGKQVVDVREIGTILRSLGCCPTEAEVQEVILATENKEATGNIPLINFLPYMTKAMIEHRKQDFAPTYTLGPKALNRTSQPLKIRIWNFRHYLKNCKHMPLCDLFYPASAETLLAAFKFFDEEGRGYLTKETFTKLMMEEGEPFTQEELDEMMQTALDPVTNVITYECYINQLMAASSEAYRIADKEEEERRRLEELAPKKKDVATLLRELQ